MTAVAAIPFCRQVMAAVAGLPAFPAAAPLAACKMMLFNNPAALGGNTTLASLTECVFTGYARVALVFSGNLEEGGAEVEVFSNLATFRSTSGTPADVIYGYAILDAATPTPNVLWAELLPSPIAISGPNEGVSLVANFTYAGGDLEGAAIVN